MIIKTLIYLFNYYIIDLFLGFTSRSFERIYLPQCNTYLIEKFNELPPYRTAENFDIAQFELKVYVNADSIEEAQRWFTEFQSTSKTTMAQTRGFNVKGNRVIFRELRHCIHSNIVKKKQGNREVRNPQSSRARNIYCDATIHIRLERNRLPDSHPLEILTKRYELHWINLKIVITQQSQNLYLD